MRPEQIHEIELPLIPGIMSGQVIEVGKEPFVVVGIVHSVAGYSTSRLKVVEPNWVWKFKYKTKRSLRRAWWFITWPLRQIQAWRRRG